jgi:hypothetical protein
VTRLLGWVVPVAVVIAVGAFLLLRSDGPDVKLSLGAPGYTARGSLIGDREALERAARAWTSGRVLWAGNRGGHELVVLTAGGKAASVRDGRVVSEVPFRPSDAYVPVGRSALLLADATPQTVRLASGRRLAARAGLLAVPERAGALIAGDAVILLPARSLLSIHDPSALLDPTDGPLVVAALRAAIGGPERDRRAVVLGRVDVVQAPSGRSIGARAAGVVVTTRRGLRPAFAVGYREREGAPAHGELLARLGVTETRHGSVAVDFLRPGWFAMVGDPRIRRMAVDTESAELEVHNRFAIIGKALAGVTPMVRGYTTDGHVVRAFSFR